MSYRCTGLGICGFLAACPVGLLGTLNNKYFDFIESTIGPTQFNGSTTRVDAFGSQVRCGRIALMVMRQRCENAVTFAEDRPVTFSDSSTKCRRSFSTWHRCRHRTGFLVPTVPFIRADSTPTTTLPTWMRSGLSIPKTGPNAGGLGSFPDLSAASYRHPAGPGSFSPEGKLLNQSVWSDSQTFYRMTTMPGCR